MRNLKDEKILLTDDERRVIVTAIDFYKKEILSKEQNQSDNIQKILELSERIIKKNVGKLYRITGDNNMTNIILIAYIKRIEEILATGRQRFDGELNDLYNVVSSL